MISIEFSTVHGNQLYSVLESIRSQTFQDYEVIIVNSNPDLSDTIKESGSVEIFRKTGKLEARELAHKMSHGDREFLLEETRILKKDALERLSSDSEADMTIVGENEIGESFVNRINRVDARLAAGQSGATPENLYLLPRYFRREVLDYSFKQAHVGIPDDIFPRIVASDLEIIYSEGFKKYRNIKIIRDELIDKFGEASFLESFRKYYRYGQTHKMLRNTSYSDFYSFQRRRRSIPNIKYLPAILGIYAIRGTGFFLGYYFGQG